MSATTPLVHEAARLAREIRRDPAQLAFYHYPPKMELATTCCCHIVIEDQNVRRHDVDSCVEQAAQQQHGKCLRLALLLQRASRTQRMRIAYLAWRWTPFDMEKWR